MQFDWKQTKTDLPVDATLWSKCGNFLTVGTYKYEPESRGRHGSLEFYNLDKNTDSLSRIAILPTKSAILDIISYNKDDILVGESSGVIGLFKQVYKNMSIGKDAIADSYLSVGKSADNSALLKLCNNNGYIWYSTENGSIGCYRIDNDKSYDCYSVLSAHEYNAWTVFSYDSTGRLAISGGDDCKFKLWDIREGCHKSSGLNGPTYFNSGIVSIDNFCPYNSTACSDQIDCHSINADCNQLLICSFDEDLTVWDLRFMKNRPIFSSDVKLGGACWRTCWKKASCHSTLRSSTTSSNTANTDRNSCNGENMIENCDNLTNKNVADNSNSLNHNNSTQKTPNSQEKYQLACAMMSYGLSIFEFDAKNLSFNEVYHNKISQNPLVYGIDWHPNRNIISYCSFYECDLGILSLLS